MTSNRRLGTGFASVLLLALAPVQAEQEKAEPPITREAVCRRAERPPVIDGKLDDAAWAGAEVIDRFAAYWDRADTGTGTRARLVWDDEALYYAATMTDSELRSFGTKRNDRLWLGDVFELFFKPHADRPEYYEFQVNPRSVILELAFPERGFDFATLAAKPPLGMRAAAVVDGTLGQPGDQDRGWTVEGRIPWSIFASTGGRPEPGAAWRFALCRYDYGPEGTKPVLMSSAPLTRPSFHRYEDYGLLRFEGPLHRQTSELPAAKPADVGLSPGKLAELTPALQKLVDDGKIAGGVALIARHGKVAYTAAFGFRNLEQKTPMTEDTIFRIASMSKPITCLAVMILVEQGKLGLDDPVAKYLPELKAMRVLGDPKDDQGDTIATVPADRPITVRHLLAHTAGFSYVTRSPDPRLKRSYAPVTALEESPGVWRDSRTVADLVERLGKVALVHQPGEGWTYGMSHDVLGRLIEVISGRSFDRYLKEHLFMPLDMSDTFFIVPEAKRDRVATLYLAADGGGLAPQPRNHGSATFFSGGGGLFSTARDYARFAEMLLEGGTLAGRRIVRADTIRAMTSNQIGTLSTRIDGLDPSNLMGRKYGLGFGLEFGPGSANEGAEPILLRYFWGGAYSTSFWIDPRHEVVALVLTQVLPFNHGNTSQVFRGFVDAAIE